MTSLLHVRDPGLLSLRRAARVMVIAPGAFALGDLVLDDEIAGLFAVFGSFAPLVFADFGGPPRSRAVAYVATALVGAVLIVIGTALSGELVAATAAVFAIGFAVRFAGVFGGHVEAAGLPLILAYVLAVAAEVPFSEIESRLIGWLGAGALVTLGALVLWPQHGRAHLLRTAGAACRALAAATRDAGSEDEATRAVQGFRAEFAHMPYRPAGPSEHDRAFLRLADQLIRLVGYLPAAADGEDDRRLVVAIATTLEATATRLEGGREAPDLLELERVRRTHRAAVSEQAAAALHRGAPAEDVLERLDASFGLRVASFGALSLAANSLLLSGEPIPPADEFEMPPEVPKASGMVSVLRVGLRQLRAHLAPSSPRLHDAIRGAVGLAIAVFVAVAADLSHAFWVVLGTLAVLRSNALGTGRTAAEAILGATVGFVVGSALMLAIGTDTTVLWIAVPVTVFLAAYTPTAVHFVVGQAAFTVFVVVAFNIIDPIGWEVGLVRVEDVAIGAGVSLVVGLLLWPRGGRAVLRTSAAGAYRLGARYLADGFGLALRGDAGDRLGADRAAVVGASDRLSEALRQHLGEPGTHLGVGTWGTMLAGPRHMRATGDALTHLVAYYGKPTGLEGGPGFASAVDRLTDRFREFADTLEDGSRVADPDPSGSPAEATREEVMGALESWRGSPDDRHLRGTLRLVWTRDWLRWLGDMERELPRPAAEVAATASTPWWRL